MVISRLLEDEKFDWFKKLNSLSWHYNNIIKKNVDLHEINADGETENVMGLVLYYMRRYTED